MTCAFCSASTTEVMRAFHGDVPGASVAGLRCGHFNVVSGGSYSRIGTYVSGAATGHVNNFEAPTGMTSAALATALGSLKSLATGKR